ncbi:hypothetical protein EMIT043CA1_40175 [Pseudomonas brassicacearum]
MGGLDWVGLDWVHIRCCGNGCLGFRPDGGSLLKSAKVKRFCPTTWHLASARCALTPALLRGPPRRAILGRGYPGIHAGMPTAQCLRSAIVVNGAPEINVHAEAAL